jgi:hypothetical protein
MSEHLAIVIIFGFVAVAAVMVAINVLYRSFD